MAVLPNSRVRLMVETQAGELLAGARDAGGTTFRLKNLAARATGVPLRGIRAGNFPALPPPLGGDATMWDLAEAASPTPRAHPWDQAHDFVKTTGAEYAEPDFEQDFIYEPPDLGLTGFAPLLASLDAEDACKTDPLRGPFPPTAATTALDWHTDDAHTQLAAARRMVNDPGDRRLRIGHLDTGYDPDHPSLPRHLAAFDGWDFRDGDRDAAEPPMGWGPNNVGHGPGTLSILAGNQVRIPGGPGLPQPQFNDFLGGAPFAEIVPIRIANSVVHFFSSSMADGIDHAVAQGCRVISISMGGVPTRRWARAVNDAYDAGVTIVAAAGNNIRDGFPTRELVWPARFNRVIAVCGADFDGNPYYLPGNTVMQGNFGPPAAMRTAMAAYTPNILWAKIHCKNTVDRDGSGTSSATPQVAAAAWLWLQHHWSALVSAGLTRWQHVEAVRHALFSTADRSHATSQTHFGNGILRAATALTTGVTTTRPQESRDHVWFPLLNLLTGFDRMSKSERDMLETEALQLATTAPAIAEYIGVDPADIPIPERQAIVRRLSSHPDASEKMKRTMNSARA